MRALFIASWLQLIVGNHDAFVPQHTFAKRHLTQDDPNSRLRLPRKSFYKYRYKGTICASIASNAQVSFEIPKLEDGVTCGGRDMITHVKYLHKSALDLTGRGVFERMNLELSDDSADAAIYQSVCRNERYVLISHGKQEDPVYNFGNLACLQAFSRSWDNLCSMPSKLCVVSKSQDEALRIELMHNVTNYGFVDGEYRGYRVRGDGTFIKLTECCVWNCYDYNGEYIGQAALFDREISPIVDSTDR